MIVINSEELLTLIESTQNCPIFTEEIVAQNVFETTFEIIHLILNNGVGGICFVGVFASNWTEPNPVKETLDFFRVGFPSTRASGKKPPSSGHLKVRGKTSTGRFDAFDVR